MQNLSDDLKDDRLVSTTLTKRKSMRRPNKLPNGRCVIMTNTIGRKNCTAWHTPNNTAYNLSTYNLSTNLLDKYDSGALTLHELVNELFEPWEQVDESQHILVAVALQTAAEGIPMPHVGTGEGGSSSDLPWNDNDKDKYQRPKSKGRR